MSCKGGVAAWWNAIYTRVRKLLTDELGNDIVDELGNNIIYE